MFHHHTYSLGPPSLKPDKPVSLVLGEFLSGLKELHFQDQVVQTTAKSEPEIADGNSARARQDMGARPIRNSG